MPPWIDKGEGYHCLVKEPFTASIDERLDDGGPIEWDFCFSDEVTLDRGTADTVDEAKQLAEGAIRDTVALLLCMLTGERTFDVSAAMAAGACR